MGQFASVDIANSLLPADGSTVANTTTLTAMHNAQQQTAAPIGPFPTTVGRILRINAVGKVSTSATPGTLKFTLNSIFDGGTMALAASKTAVSWTLQIDCLIASQAGTLIWKSFGIFTSEAVIGSPAPSAGGSGTLVLPSTDGFTSSPVSRAITVSLNAQWSSASASNTITLQQLQMTWIG
jgi:hypothetical protein